MLARWYADVARQLQAQLKKRDLSPEDLDRIAGLEPGDTARLLDPAKVKTHMPLPQAFQDVLETLYSHGGTLVMVPAQPAHKRHPRPKQLTLPLDTQKI